MRYLLLAAALVAVFAAPIRAGEDALDEVNAYRTSRGLKPFIKCDGLMEAARKTADFRAAHLLFGHTSSDFAFVPSGYRADAAGCAAYPASYGWLSCCMDDNYVYAGAAWTLGRDGKRYMHLFVRDGGGSSTMQMSSTPVRRFSIRRR